MRAIIRAFGVFLIALALVLAIVDGASSLAENALVVTPLAESWERFDVESFAQVKQSLISKRWGAADALVAGLLALPTAASVGVLGLFLVWLGRKRRRPTELRKPI